MRRRLYLITPIILFSLIFASPGLAEKSFQKTCPEDSVCLDNPLKTDSPQKLIGQVIKGGLGLIGSLALAMFVYGGFTWMLSAGNSTQVEKGKSILIWATIGLVFIFSSYAVLQFIFQDVLGV